MQRKRYSAEFKREAVKSWQAKRAPNKAHRHLAHVF
jgi:hypothetical protein